MLGERIKLFRCARGLSQEALVNLMGGLVTKQSISKYELGSAEPSPKIINRIAAALNVKVSQLWNQPPVDIHFIAYRKGSGLTKSGQEQIEAYVQQTLEDRIRLNEITGGDCYTPIPVNKMKVASLQDIEDSAEQFREDCKLGSGPISSVTAMLEDRNVYVIEVDAPENFDGISAYVTDADKKTIAAAVASRKNNICGERQRLNLTHELGHLILDVAPNMDEEKAAFCFGAALLAPRQAILCEVGSKRTQISPAELFLLKKKFGLSIQSLLMRLADLEIISQSCLRSYFHRINKLGWKKKEPEESPPEKPQWLTMNVYKALSEGLISFEKAELLLGQKPDVPEIKTSTRARSFMKLSKEQRDKILSDQARKYREEYEKDSDWLDMGDGYES